MERPRILAGFVQGTLGALEPAAAAAVRARLRAATRIALDESSRLAWLPVEIDVELTEAIYAELGAGRARETFRRGLSAALEAPILRSLVQGALRLLGPTPGRLFSWAPKVYAQLYRDAGEMRFAGDGPGTARLELLGLPSPIVGSRDYLDGLAGALAAGFDLLRRKGDATLEHCDPAAQRASFRLAWEDEDEPVESLPEPAGA